MLFNFNKRMPDQYTNNKNKNYNLDFNLIIKTFMNNTIIIY